MDINATLERLRRLAIDATRIAENEPHRDTSHIADEMAELFQALDTWLARGGLLPAAWTIGRAK